MAASCSIPLIYRSATLRAKGKDGNLEDWNLSDQRWIDGSVEGDLPIQRIAELFNVNLFHDLCTNHVQDYGCRVQ